MMSELPFRPFFCCQISNVIHSPAHVIHCMAPNHFTMKKFSKAEHQLLLASAILV